MTTYISNSIPIDDNGEIIFNRNAIQKPSEIVVSETQLNQTLTEYLPIFGGTLMGNLEIGNNSTLTMNGATQRSAFTDANSDTLNLVSSKTSNITTDGTTTTITGDVVISDAIFLPNNAIGISKVSGLQTNLNNHSTSINSHSTILTRMDGQLNNLISYDTLNDTTIGIIQSDLTTKASQISLLEAYNTTNDGNITSLNNSVSSNTTNIGNLQTSVSNNTSNITLLNSGLEALDVVVQTKVGNTEYNTFKNSTNAKLTEITHTTDTTTFSNIVNMDEAHTNSLVVNNSIEIDGTMIISNNDYTITNQQFSYLKDIDENIKTKHNSIDGNILQTMNDIANISSTVGSHTTTITSILSNQIADENNITDLLSDVISINTTLTTHDGTLSSLGSTVSTHTGQISSLQSYDTTITNLITALQNNKQNNLNSSNLLSCDYIADGSVGNLEFQTLNGIDTTHSIQWQIDQINSSLSVLDGLQDIDITSISNINSTLQTINTSISDLNATTNSLGIYDTNNTTIRDELLTFKDTTEDYIISNDASITTINDFINSQTTTNSGVSSNLSTLNSFRTSQLTINNSNSTNLETLNTFKTSTEAYQTNNDGVVSELVSFKTDQLTTNNSTTSSINTLNSFKTSQLTLNSQTATNISDLQTANTSRVSYENANDTNIQGINDNLGILNSFKTTQESTNTTLQNNIDLKQNIIAIDNKIASSLISTNINSTPSVLNTVLDSITSINTTQSSNITTLQSDVSNINNSITAIGGEIDTLQTNYTSLQSQDVVHSSAIDSINTQLTQYSSDFNLKENVIGTNHKISSAYISTTINNGDTLNNVLTQIENDLTTANSNIDLKQNILNSTTNKLPIAYVNLGTSALSYCDISSSLTTQLTNINSAVSSLQGLQAGDTTSFNQINADLDYLNDTVVLKQDIINSSNRLNANLIGTGEVSNTVLNYLTGCSSNIQQQIQNISVSGGGVPSIAYNSGLAETTISGTTIITDLKFSGDSSTQSTAFTTSKNTDLSNCKNKLIDVSYLASKTTIANNLECNNITGTTIDNINSAIALKNDVIDVNNKLNPAHINSTGGTLTAQKIAYLSSIASDLATQLISLQSQITSLSETDSSQTSWNANTTNTISGLITNKQDLLDATNKLNPSFINCGTGSLSSLKCQYLSSVSGDLQTSLDGKQNVIADGDLSISKTLNLQSSLDGKWTTPSNATNLGYVDINSSLNTLLSGKQATLSNSANVSYIDINSSLTTLLSGKQDTLSNSANVANVDITSSLNTLLSGKQATLSNASNVAYVDINSSLNTLLSGKQATINNGSLTIAHTNGLQTLLDAKYPQLRQFITVASANTLYTVAGSDLNQTIIISAIGTGSRNVKLPDEATYEGNWVRFINPINTSGNTLNFQNSSGVQIAGTASNTALAGTCTEFMSNGTLWLRSN